MKKALAILLTVIMAVSIIPMGALAASDVILTTSASFSTSNDLVSGTKYIIPAGVTMTVPEDITLFIPSEARLEVQEGGTLKVFGKVNVQKGGELYVAGTLINSDNVIGEGSALAEMRFPKTSAICALCPADTVSCSHVKISVGIESFTGKVTYGEVADEEIKSANLNAVVYVKVEITEPNPNYNMYDDNYVNVGFNGVTVPGTAGVHQTKLTTGCDVTFTKFDGSTYFYNDCDVVFPAATGYEITGANGETGTFNVKYGTQVSFKLDIDEDYNQSIVQVYIHNGAGYVNGEYELEGDQVTDENGNLLFLSGLEPAKPDEYGYYTFTVKGNSTVHVIGVIENARLDMISDILSVVRNVFDMIKSFIAQFLALFGITM